ncbi:YhbY family RNA-binding protein [candidate division KSB1 bacterium]|nr:YhbY family RNA-binding protein [candidate division KSB1 bacterium]
MKYLKALAHHLKPVVYIGKNGADENVLNALLEAFGTQELVKVKFVEFKEERKVIAADIAERGSCFLVQIIGHVAVFYKAGEGENKIVLPH